jgi:DNA-directed RNA polymerase subunit RPC12/RpoP
MPIYTIVTTPPQIGFSTTTNFASAPVMGTDVRCPHCDKKLGERLVGTLEVTCPRCKRKVTITR